VHPLVDITKGQQEDGRTKEGRPPLKKDRVLAWGPKGPYPEPGVGVTSEQTQVEEGVWAERTLKPGALLTAPLVGTR
jgi:hypothetical protein